MWTLTTRQQHTRLVSRYQTDLTDAEWRVIAPHLPKPCAMGRPREWPMREIVNGIFYVMRAGCPWRLLPNDLPPWGTIYRWFATWRDDGRFERINHALVMADRERVGRNASPSAAIIDSQSIKTTEAGRRPHPSAAFATSARAPSSPRWRRRPAAAAPPRRPERVAPLTDAAIAAAPNRIERKWNRRRRPGGGPSRSRCRPRARESSDKEEERAPLNRWSFNAACWR